MAELIQEIEEIPASFPTPPSGLSSAAWAVDSDAIWQRIEAYTILRFTARQVIWIVEGEGDWCPQLAPLTITAEEIWDGSGWTAATVYASPYGGYRLTCAGPYRFTGTVGGGDVPPAVSEAFRRLAEYMAEDSGGAAGLTSYSVNMAGAIQESYQRSAAHAARALQLSGAADLLRPYRRQK